ncbi:PKD domain-containing protein [Sesbania bispinosa]|nr:PKD domain-containing protein [Sesbania bispinosa]
MDAARHHRRDENGRASTTGGTTSPRRAAAAALAENEKGDAVRPRLCLKSTTVTASERATCLG